MNPKEFRRWIWTLHVALFIWLLAGLVSFVSMMIMAFKGPFWIFLVCSAFNAIIIFSLMSGWWIKPWKDFQEKGN